MGAPVPPLSAADFLALDTYSYDEPTRRTIPDTWNDYKRIWIVGAFIQYVLEAIEQAGPVGAVFALDASAQNAAGQYTAQKRPAYYSWRFSTFFNHHHMAWAWLSLFSVGFADLYIRLCAMGVWKDVRFF